MKKKTDKELISDALALHSSIYVTECYGTKDMVLYELICDELEGRGYEIAVTEKLSITRDGVWRSGYCVYYGSEEDGHRESFRTFSGALRWLKKHGKGVLGGRRVLKGTKLIITMEQFDEELWDQIGD